MSLLTAADVARELRLTPAWVLHLARAGVIGSVRFGRRVRFRREDVDRYIERSEQQHRQHSSRVLLGGRL